MPVPVVIPLPPAYWGDSTYSFYKDRLAHRETPVSPDILLRSRRGLNPGRLLSSPRLSPIRYDPLVICSISTLFVRQEKEYHVLQKKQL